MIESTQKGINVFSKEQTTNITFTVVPALYGCGITSDNVEYYIVNSEADINTLHSGYGDLEIVDYDKVIIA